MNVVLYRPSLDARSGAGQLLEMQWRGLTAARTPAVIACDRGALKFWLRTGVRARRRSLAQLARSREQGAVLIDHGMSLPSADIVFVHNLASEARRHFQLADAAAADREREFFRKLNPSALVVANSRVVAAALQAHFALGPERVTVLHPGYRTRRYTPQRAHDLRGNARAALGLAPDVPLVGFVTSGDFAKRGLDLFLDCATQIRFGRPDAKFLVVGSKHLPHSARAHALVRDGILTYRPKNRRPDFWMSALDLFLYAARFEEFGMVVAEAQALAVPVLTSRVVGASECLPKSYERWLLESPDVAAFATNAVALLADAEARRQLAAEAAAHVTKFGEAAYVAGTLRLLETQNRRLK